MNLVAIIICIMALTEKRIRFILKVSLSTITSYHIFKHYNPDTVLIEFKEYDLNVIRDFINNGYCFKSFFLMWLVYAFIYLIIPYIIILFSEKVLVVFTSRKYYKDEYSTNKNKETMGNYIPAMFNMMEWLNLIKEDSLVITNHQKYDSLLRWFINLFVFFIHFLICLNELNVYNGVTNYFFMIPTILVFFILLYTFSIVKPIYLPFLQLMMDYKKSTINKL